MNGMVSLLRQRRSSIDQTPPEEDFVIEAILANEDL